MISTKYSYIVQGSINITQDVVDNLEDIDTTQEVVRFEFDKKLECIDVWRMQ